MLKRPSDGFWAGLVVGIVVVTLLMAFHVDISGSDEDKVPSNQIVKTSSKAAQDFVDEWQKMATGTWLVESSYTRTLNNGQKYAASVRDVQRPPDYLDEAPTAVSASISGRLYTCASADEGKVSGCRDYGEAAPFATYAQSRVDSVKTLVTGSSATYGVQGDDGDCFELYLNPGKTANNWGDHSRFCFDAKSHAPVMTAIYNEGAEDITQATRVAAPTDDDFKLQNLDGVAAQ